MSSTISSRKYSNLDLIEACDSFPYDNSNFKLYKLYLPHDDRPYGHILPSIVGSMPWTSAFTIDHSNLTVHLQDSSDGDDPTSACTQALAELINTAIDNDIFDILHGQHSELYPILGYSSDSKGSANSRPVTFERFAGDLFGFVARGAHLTVYTTDPEHGMRIWVPCRGAHMFTYPNKLDTTVAGGVPAHQTPWENVLSEADEEASLPRELIERSARSAGALTYMGVSGEANGGEEQLICSDIVYVFDMEVEADVKPVPKDGEVKEFYLMSVEEVRAALGRGEFKTNSAVVMIDFFIRHGTITPENEPDYVEIVTRMHRRLPFPTTCSAMTKQKPPQ